MMLTGSSRKMPGSRVQPSILDIEIVAPAARLQKARQQPASDGRRFFVLFFQRGAEDAGQIADILGHQEVGAHEGFDGAARLSDRCNRSRLASSGCTSKDRRSSARPAR